MGKEEIHGIPDHIQRVIDNNNWLMNPAPFPGPSYPHHSPYMEQDMRKFKNDKLLFEPGDWAKWWRMVSNAEHIGVSSILNNQGNLEVFGINSSGLLWGGRQIEEPRLYMSNIDGFNYLNSDRSLKVKRVTPFRNADGRLEVFALGNDLALHNIWQKWPGGQWSDWNDLGGQLKSGVTVGDNIDGRMELFALGSNNDIQHRWQTAPNGGWSDWASQGGYLLGGVSVQRNRSEGLEIFGVGKDHAVWNKWQWGPSSGWSDWNSLGGHLISNVSACRHPDDKRLEIFGVGQDHNLWHRWQDSSNNWVDWQRQTDFKIDNVTCDVGQDGVMNIFSYSGRTLWNLRWSWNQGWSDWVKVYPGESNAYSITHDSQGRVVAFIEDDGVYCGEQK